MKALKTVAVALGITLGALIVIPLAVLAGLFVWLKLTEEADEEILELDQREAPDPEEPVPATTQTPAGPAGVGACLGGIRLRDSHACPSSAGCGCERVRPARPRPPSRRDRRPHRHGVWAGNFIVVKGAVGVLPPVGFTFLRYCLAALTLLALLRWREGSFRLPRGDIVPVFLLGAIGFGCYQMLWTVALQTVPAGDSALLIAATPVMTALLAMAVGADTPNTVKVVGA